MKRKDAIAKVTKICERLDAVVGTPFLVIPLSLHLFGSVLTDKADPRDVDMVLRYEYPERTDEELAEEVFDLTYGRPSRDDKARIALAQGMKQLRWQLIGTETVEHFLTVRTQWATDTPMRLVWEPGKDWRGVLADIVTHPLPWNADADVQRKQANAARRPATP